MEFKLEQFSGDQIYADGSCSKLRQNLFWALPDWTSCR